MLRNWVRGGPIADIAEQDLQATIRAWDQAAWSLAALALRLKALAYGGTPIDDAAACQLLHKAGLTSVRTVPTPAGAPAITIGQNSA